MTTSRVIGQHLQNVFIGRGQGRRCLPKRKRGGGVAMIWSHRRETIDFGDFMNAVAAKKPDPGEIFPVRRTGAI
jgi:hypothetical protein